eukprot:TRINITY_DN15059_c0_g1_i1.p1 TRINITY_DN15059_c0_g1~~TRINITY_DN15059_c0_g1_i1.p1  ORF type:complete len:237 (-),score=30.60 TRINITY_DN15059_c0_g1_i1:76-786(-)
MINEKDECTQCKGNKVIQEKKVLDVYVKKGMQHGQKIVFSWEADEAPNAVTGDIVIMLQLKEHPMFKRKENDLYVEHTLGLTEALCGFLFALTHLDGRRLLIKSNPGKIIKPGQYKIYEGMPNYHLSFLKGSLYINFNVEFPIAGALSPDQHCTLETIQAQKSGTHLLKMEQDKWGGCTWEYTYMTPILRKRWGKSNNINNSRKLMTRMMNRWHLEPVELSNKYIFMGILVRNLIL